MPGISRGGRRDRLCHRIHRTCRQARFCTRLAPPAHPRGSFSPSDGEGAARHERVRHDWRAFIPMFESLPACPSVALAASRIDPAGGCTPGMPARSPGSHARSFSTCGWLLDFAGLLGSSRFRVPPCGRWRPVKVLFEARFLARRCLRLHVTRRARLEVQMVRYPFSSWELSSPTARRLPRRLRSLAVKQAVLSLTTARSVAP